MTVNDRWDGTVHREGWRWWARIEDGPGVWSVGPYLTRRKCVRKVRKLQDVLVRMHEQHPFRSDRWRGRQ